MQDIPLGQLLVVIAFILFPLLNWLLQRIQRRFETQSPREEPPRQPAPRTFAKLPPQEVIAPTRERMPALELVETPRPRTPRRHKTFFGNRRDLRRAIVLMAVLGPCRAVDQVDR